MGVSSSSAASNRAQITSTAQAISQGPPGSGGTGEVWYVNSGSTTATDGLGLGTSPLTPFATVDFAVGQATANNDDLIIVMPGHTETIATNSAWAMDKAGISVVGLGLGTLRPTFTMTATASVVLMTAADCAIKNILFVAATADHTNSIAISATDCQVIDCEFRHGSSIENINGIDIGGGASVNLADRTRISGCIFSSPTVGAFTAILLSEVEDGVVIENCRIFGEYSEACIHNTASDVLTNLTIKDCMLTNSTTGQHSIQLLSACTGNLIRNYYNNDMTQATGADVGACWSFQCFHSDATDLSAVPSPVIT